VLGIERDCGVDVVDDVPDAHRSHGIPPAGPCPSRYPAHRMRSAFTGLLDQGRHMSVSAAIDEPVAKLVNVRITHH
jgi:hypothetical protein